MLIFFGWVIWFWLLITVFADLFRRHDTSGFAKVLWIIFVIVLPFLGVFIYLIANNEGMAERNIAQVEAQQAQMDTYVSTPPEAAAPRRRSRRPRASSTRARSRRPSSTRSRQRRSPRQRIPLDESPAHPGGSSAIPPTPAR